MRSITILISYPRDQESSAKAAKQAINEASDTLFHHDVQVRVIDWLDNVTTGTGTRAQEVVNGQTSGIDGILAIFGHRLGQPTGEHESGTTEEISLARSKFGVSSGRVNVFFKSSTNNLAEVDPSELQRLNDYRKKLAAEGILYADFGRTERLKKLVRQAVGRIVLESPKEVAAEAAVDPLVKPMTFDESYKYFVEHEWAKKYPIVGAIATIAKTLTDLGVATGEDKLAENVDLVGNPQAAVAYLADTDKSVSDAVLRLRENLDIVYSTTLRQVPKVSAANIAGQTGVFFLMALMQLGTGLSMMVSEDYKEKASTIRALESDEEGFVYARDRLANTIEEIASIIETSGAEIVAIIQQAGWRVDLPNIDLLADSFAEALGEDDDHA